MDSPAGIVVCGSLSRHPVSLGASMHTAGYRALGLDWIYAPFRVEEDLPGAVRAMRALGVRGLGVSMPFKVQILPLLDHVDDLARRIGAVNTLVNDGGSITGYNTDAWGGVAALREAAPIVGKRVVVLGAGGAARAVAYGLVAEGAIVHVANRTLDRAAALAEDLRGAFPDRAAATSGALSGLPGREFDVLVNCSSAGMSEYGAASPVPEVILAPDRVVMDIVYKPIETELLRAAKGRRCRTVHGGRMLLHQACRQFELYTGGSAPIDAMDAALRAAIG